MKRVCTQAKSKQRYVGVRQLAKESIGGKTCLKGEDRVCLVKRNKVLGSFAMQKNDRDKQKEDR